MIKLPFGIFADLENDRVEPGAHPADGAVLRRKVQTLIQIIRVKRKLPALPQIRCRASDSAEDYGSSARRNGSACWYNSYTTEWANGEEFLR